MTSPSTPTESEEKKVLSANATPTSSRSSLLKVVEFGRPNIDTIVKRAVDSVPRDCRVLVAASGPSSLLADARMAAKASMTSQSAGLHLHLEQFDW